MSKVSLDKDLKDIKKLFGLDKPKKSFKAQYEEKLRKVKEQESEEDYKQKLSELKKKELKQKLDKLKGLFK